jgi:hypothetical protein
MNPPLFLLKIGLSAECGAYLNTAACGKTAQSPHFMRVFGRRYQQ